MVGYSSKKSRGLPLNWVDYLPTTQVARFGSSTSMTPIVGGVAYPIVPMPNRGTSANDRLARTARCKYIDARFDFHRDQFVTTSTTANSIIKFRVLLVSRRINAQNTSSITAANVLQYGTTPQEAVNSFYNISEIERFNIICDHTFTLGAPQSVSVDSGTGHFLVPAVNVTKHFHCKVNRDVKFQADAPTTVVSPNQVEENYLQWIIIGAHALGTTAQTSAEFDVTCSLSQRLRFYPD